MSSEEQRKQEREECEKAKKAREERAKMDTEKYGTIHYEWEYTSGGASW